MKANIIILFAFLISCNPIEENYIDPTLQPYYNQFMAEAKERGITIKAKSITLDWSTEINKGHCKWGKTWAKIRINPYLDSANYNLHTEITVFHELGHGLLERHHLPKEEFSIMAVPRCRDDYFDYSKRNEYLNELFNASNKN